MEVNQFYMSVYIAVWPLCVCVCLSPPPSFLSDLPIIPLVCCSLSLRIGATPDLPHPLTSRMMDLWSTKIENRVGSSGFLSEDTDWSEQFHRTRMLEPEHTWTHSCLCLLFLRGFLIMLELLPLRGLNGLNGVGLREGGKLSGKNVAEKIIWTLNCWFFQICSCQSRQTPLDISVHFRVKVFICLFSSSFISRGFCPIHIWTSWWWKKRINDVGWLQFRIDVFVFLLVFLVWSRCSSQSDHKSWFTVAATPGTAFSHGAKNHNRLEKHIYLIDMWFEFWPFFLTNSFHAMNNSFVRVLQMAVRRSCRCTRCCFTCSGAANLWFLRRSWQTCCSGRSWGGRNTPRSARAWSSPTLAWWDLHLIMTSCPSAAPCRTFT